MHSEVKKQYLNYGKPLTRQGGSLYKKVACIRRKKSKGDFYIPVWHMDRIHPSSAA